MSRPRPSYIVDISEAEIIQALKDKLSTADFDSAMATLEEGETVSLRVVDGASWSFMASIVKKGKA